MATPTPHLVDDILEEIFVRLPTPAALARASTACPSFRRIITAPSFLRRFCKHHPPPLLGFASYTSGFHPADESHTSAPLARAFADAADFSYSFVPMPNDGLLTPWCPCDVRDGRVLLECSSKFHVPSRGCSLLSDIDIDIHIDTAFPRVFTNLAVCDPISRRYVLLPPIPEEMRVAQEHLAEFEPMLAPIDEDEDEMSFRVICTAHHKGKLVTFVFSSVTRQWCIAASPSWSSLGTVEPSWSHLGRFTYIHGCFYWTEVWKDKLLVLDARIMEFSTVDFRNQPGHAIYMHTVVDGTKGALEMLSVAGDYSLMTSGSFYVYHTTQQNDGGSSNDWQLKNVMELPRRCMFNAMGAKEGFLFLREVPDPFDDALPEDNPINIFSLEVKTFELKKVCRARYSSDCVDPYFGFPPSLSKPSL